MPLHSSKNLAADKFISFCSSQYYPCLPSFYASIIPQVSYRICLPLQQYEDNLPTDGTYQR